MPLKGIWPWRPMQPALKALQLFWIAGPTLTGGGRLRTQHPAVEPVDYASHRADDP